MVSGKKSMLLVLLVVLLKTLCMYASMMRSATDDAGEIQQSPEQDQFVASSTHIHVLLRTSKMTFSRLSSSCMRLKEFSAMSLPSSATAARATAAVARASVALARAVSAAQPCSAADARLLAAAQPCTAASVRASAAAQSC
jgi:hypothetical protein